MLTNCRRGTASPATIALFGHVDQVNLKERSASAVRLNLVAQAIMFLMQIGSTIALSRILAPEQFGLVGMASIVTNFISMFRDAGLTQAVVQRESITENQISTLFWINLLICSGLSVVLAASAPLVVWAFDEPQLLWITVGLAAPFFVSGFGIQHRALLIRHMRFGSIALAELAGFTVAVIAAIAAAISGWGIWALVLMPLIRHLICALLFINGTRWIPGPPVRGSGARSMLAFGANITGVNLINYFSRSSDNIIIGKLFGPAMLGQYSRAYGLIITPLSQVNAPIGKSLLPTLSRMITAPSEYQALYLKYNRNIAWLLCLPIAISSYIGEPLFISILGEEWRTAGQLFEWLAVASMLQPLTNLTGLIFVTTNRTRVMFRWSILNAAIVITGFVIGAHLYETTGVAVSYAFTNLLLAPVCFWIAFRGSPVKLSSFLRQIGLPIGLAIAVVSCRFFL